MTATALNKNEIREYNLMIRARGTAGEALTDRTTWLIVMWLAASLFWVVPIFLIAAGIVPLDLSLYIGFGLQIVGLLFYLPLMLFYKNGGFKARSGGDVLTWAVIRKKSLLWRKVLSAAVVQRKQLVQEKPSLIMVLEVDDRRKPVRFYFEKDSGLRFLQELKEREILIR